MGQLSQNNIFDYQEELNRLRNTVKLSKGTFALILVLCNHQALWEKICDELKKEQVFSELTLNSSDKNLLQLIKEKTFSNDSSALLISGLYNVANLEAFLKTFNSDREKFKKDCSFPIILQVTNKTREQLYSKAKDFASTASTFYHFNLTEDELKKIVIDKKISQVFERIRELGSYGLAITADIKTNLDSQNQYELLLIIEKLEQNTISLTQYKRACLYFALGQTYPFISEKTKKYFEKSLENWVDNNSQVNSERKGYILYSLGIWWLRHAMEQPTEHTSKSLEQAENYLSNCIKVFKKNDNSRISSQLKIGFVSVYGEVLRRLRSYELLEEIAYKIIDFYKTNDQEIIGYLELVRAKSFLAEISLDHKKWNEATHRVEDALSELERVRSHQQSVSEKEANANLELECCFYEGLCYLLLACSSLKHTLVEEPKESTHQESIEEVEKARIRLENAKEKLSPSCDLQLYIDILDQLRNCYIKQKNFYQAFKEKRRRQIIERQYGLRAFIGINRLEAIQKKTNSSIDIPREISTTGRQKDIDCLRQKLTESYRHFVVIYGPSGAGKTSLLQAGLIPSLKSKPIQIEQESKRYQAIPIYINNYTDKWKNNISQKIIEEWEHLNLSELGFPMPNLDVNLDDLLENIRSEFYDDFQLIFIFDQFEDFFVYLNDIASRNSFYSFINKLLSKALNTKIIFSLRNDYLYKLTEMRDYIEKRKLENNFVPNSDSFLGILDQKHLKHVGNLSKEDAKTLIKNLNKSRRNPVLDKLVDELVKNLSEELGEVRPIELQIVGTQLESMKILTLDNYQAHGGKIGLIQSFLNEVIDDCGTDTELSKLIAQLALFALTGEDGIRPFRTRGEIKTTVAELYKESGLPTDDLIPDAEIDLLLKELVLKILLDSRLIIEKSEDSQTFYRLSHDYFIGMIRKYGNDSFIRMIRKYGNENSPNIMARQGLLEKLKNLLSETLTTELSKSTKKLTLAEIQVIKTLNTLSNNLFNTHDYLGCLLTSLKASRNLRVFLFEQIQQSDYRSLDNAALELTTIANLRKIVYEIQEKNRLEIHNDIVTSINSSADGKIIATAGQDKRLKLYTTQGKLKHESKKHDNSFTCVQFSPNSQRIATADVNGLVIIWDSKVNVLSRLQHKTEVTYLRFHPQEKKLLVSISKDQEIKFWNIESKKEFECSMIKQPKGTHIFFLNNEEFACFSGEKIEIWRLKLEDEKLEICESKIQNKFQAIQSINNLENFKYKISTFCLSEDAQKLAWVENSKLMVWDLKSSEPEFSEELSDTVTCLSFSLDNRAIAAGSTDSIIKVWDLSGNCLTKLCGHRSAVTSICFCRNERRESMLVSTSEDKTLRFWNYDSEILDLLEGHRDAVREVCFCPASRGDFQIATASDDETVRLWNQDNKEIGVLESNDDAEFTSIAFEQQKIITGDVDGKVKLWKSKPRQNLYQSENLRQHQGRITSIQFSSDGQFLASVGQDNKINLYNSRLEELLSEKLVQSGEINTLSFSDDRFQMFATGHDDGNVGLWYFDTNNIRRGRDLFTAHDKGVTCVSFKPHDRSQPTPTENQILATASEDNTVKLWNLDKNKEFTLVKELTSHTDRVNSVSFRPDGLIIASGSNDQTVKLWSSNGEELCILEGHYAGVLSVRFSPDGKILASSDGQGKVILWNFDLDDLLKRGAEYVEIYLQSNQKIQEAEGFLIQEILELIKQSSYEYIKGSSSIYFATSRFPHYSDLDT